MISINKEEANAIREKFPNTHIVRTCKQKSSRHRYYCEESRPVVNYINKMRGIESQNKKEGNRHGNRKTY